MMAYLYPYKLIINIHHTNYFINGLVAFADHTAGDFMREWMLDQADLAQREGESAGFNRLPSQGRTNIFVQPEGHLPLINTEVDDTSAGLGLKGGVGRWSYDGSVVYGENEFEFIINNSNNVALGIESPTSARAGMLTTDLIVGNLDFANEFRPAIST